MKRITALIGFLALTWLGIALSQPVTNAHTISVSGHGDASAKPDTMVVSFAIDENAPSSDQCTRLLTDTASKVVAVLKKRLGPDGKVQTADYSIGPNYGEPFAAAASSSPENWTYQSQITANADKIETIGSLIKVGLAAGAVRVGTTGFNFIPVEDKRAASGEPAMRADAGGRFGARLDIRGYPLASKKVPSVTLEVEVHSSTPEECVSRGAQLTAKVEDALKNKLGNKGTVEVSSFTVNIAQQLPQNQGYQPPQPVIRGYSAHTTVSAESHDLDKLGPLIEAGMAAGAVRLDSVTFTLRNDSAARKQALEAAAAQARSKAETVAKSMGVKLGGVLNITVNAQAQPQIVYGAAIMRSMAAGESPETRSHPERLLPVMPREVTFSADVNATYQLQ